MFHLLEAASELLFAYIPEQLHISLPWCLIIICTGALGPLHADAKWY